MTEEKDQQTDFAFKLGNLLGSISLAASFQRTITYGNEKRNVELRPVDWQSILNCQREVEAAFLKMFEAGEK